ncbi:glycosyltransferase family 2 protein [Tardisphaera saccharovorans]
MCKKAPNVAAVMLAHNHVEMTLRALSSVVATDYPALKVILVDNGSTDRTAEFVRRRFMEVEVISTGRNLGTPAGFNFGFKHAYRTADPDYFVTLDNDVIIEDANWLKELVRVAESTGAAAVGPAIIEGKETENRRLYVKGETRFISFLPYYLLSTARKATRKRLATLRVPFETDSLVGACMLISRKALEREGIYDEGFSPHGFADGDLCLRFVESGEKVIYDPSVKVRHLGGGTTGKRPFLDARARVKLWRDHWNPVLFALSFPFFMLPSPSELRGAPRSFGARIRGIASGLVAPTIVPTLEDPRCGLRSSGKHNSLCRFSICRVTTFRVLRKL